MPIEFVEEELDFDTFNVDFYRRPIGAPKSISNFLTFDCETPQKIFEMLLVLYTNGLKRAHTRSGGVAGNSGLNLNEISPDEIAEITARFAMIGIRPVIETTQTPRTFHIDNKAYMSKSRMQNMIFMLEQQGVLYKIHFEYL